MRSSSREYIEALHAGNYLLFLSWPEFIMDKYKEGTGQSGTDFLMDGLIFEWLQDDDYEKSLSSMATLYSVYESDPSILQVDTLPFCLTTLLSALVGYWVFKINKIEKKQIPSTKMTQKEVSEFMDSLTQGLGGKDYFNTAVGEKYECFMNDELSKIDSAVVRTAATKLKDVTQTLALVYQYIAYLRAEQHEEQQNSLFGARLALAQRFFSFLREQDELNDEVKEKIIEYVNAIRRQQPHEQEEEDYLRHIFPLDFLEWTRRKLAAQGARLFALVSPAPTTETVVVENEDAPAP